VNEDLALLSSGDPSLIITNRRVEVFVFRTELAEDKIQWLSTFLSDYELQKALSYRFPPRARCFKVTRGVLRGILSGIIGVHPCRIPFEYGPDGKPFIPDNAGLIPLCFNLTHCSNYGAVGVAGPKIPLGIDMEMADPRRPYMDIARRYFTPQEVQELEGAVSSDREKMFYRIWTRKEAYVKARGLGMAVSLGRVRVSGDDKPRLIDDPDLPRGEESLWRMVDLPIKDPDYYGALCFFGRGSPMEQIFHRLNF